MSHYDDLFETMTAADSVFADKGALDPLADPAEVVPRVDQERQLAAILAGIDDGYLPTTVSVYGPPGTGKTLTTRRLCTAFAARTETFGVEYVNLKECRTVFSAATELLVACGGEPQGAYVGLDGVFERLWDRLERYPNWTVLLLDEIDHVQYDANYDPNDFFYRLLRGEAKRARDLQLSVWLLSNELLEVDLRLDSRVRSAMSGEEVFFPPYGERELRAVLDPRLEQAFREEALTEAAVDRGIREAAQRWGDARKALRLFRHAGERANEADRTRVTEACLVESLGGTERAATVAKLRQLPVCHLAVLTAGVGTRGTDGTIVQPIRTSQIRERLHRPGTAKRFQLGERRIQTLVRELETMGLVESWTESHGRDGRARYVETTFDPAWVYEAQAAVAAELGDKD